MDLLTAKISEVAKNIKQKKISSFEVCDFFLQRAHKHNPQLNAFININDSVTEGARKVDQRIALGEDVGLMAGIPMGIKDMFCTQGLKTTAGSKILENFVPPYDATVIDRLKKQGALILGKLNQDEFAMGSSNETSFFGPVKNPWNLEYVPGGSSGGSAAAQSARLSMATLGTDTGGSIRQPAHFCGIVGLKPTYGRVSRFGIVAYASSLDQAGPMVSYVEDAALVLEVISGFDPKDSTTTQRKVPSFTKDLSENIKGYKVGILKEYLKKGVLHPDVEKSVDDAMSILKSQGCEFIELSVPMTEVAVSIYYLVATSEASSNLARYDGVKYGYRAPFKQLSSIDLDEFYMSTRGEGFGKEVKRRIMLGTYCLSSGYYDAYYNKACQVRRKLSEEFQQAFTKCDVILSPVATSPAFKLGDKISNPLAMYLNDIFTVSTNLAGLPGMSVPFSISKEGLPIGIQLQAAPFNEQKILNMAFNLENATKMSGKVPYGF